MAAAVSPDRQTIESVVAQATRWRRTRYQDDDRYRHFTKAAMAEQVCGEVRLIVAMGDGWWLVGRVIDVIANVELEILFCPGEKRIRLWEPTPSPEKAPPKPMLPSRPKRRFSPVSEWNREYEQWPEWQEW